MCALESDVIAASGGVAGHEYKGNITKSDVFSSYIHSMLELVFRIGLHLDLTRYTKLKDHGGGGGG